MSDYLLGICFGVLIAIFFVFMWSVGDRIQHNIGWYHTVCVTTGNLEGYRVHCATGQEIASWMKEKGR